MTALFVTLLHRGFDSWDRWKRGWRRVAEMTRVDALRELLGK